MEKFLEREALNGNLKGQYPPGNRIKWDNKQLHSLWAYISNVTEVFDWHPNECILAILDDGSDEQNLLNMMDDILNGKDGRPFPHPSEYQGKPTRVDAPIVERLREVLAGRSDICNTTKIICYACNQHEKQFTLSFISLLWCLTGRKCVYITNTCIQRTMLFTSEQMKQMALD